MKKYTKQERNIEKLRGWKELVNPPEEPVQGSFKENKTRGEEKVKKRGCSSKLQDE